MKTNSRRVRNTRAPLINHGVTNANLVADELLILTPPSDRRMLEAAERVIQSPCLVEEFLMSDLQPHQKFAKWHIGTKSHLPGDRFILRASALVYDAKASRLYNRYYCLILFPKNQTIRVINAAARSSLLANSVSSVAMPRLVNYFGNAEGLLYRQSTGKPLTEFFLVNTPKQIEKVLFTVANQLRRMHATQIEVLPRHDKRRICELARRNADVLGQRHSRYKPRLRKIVESLLLRVPTTLFYTCHGSLRAENLLIDGEKIAFVGTESCFQGDPLYDVACLSASIHELGQQSGWPTHQTTTVIRTWEDAYLAGRGHAAQERLSFNRILAFLAQGANQVTNARPGFRFSVSHILEACEEILGAQ